MKDNTFTYELWDLLRIYQHENLFAKITFSLLNRFTDMKTIYLGENDFYNAIDSEDYKWAELRLKNMVDKGININSPRMLGLNTTLTLEKMDLSEERN